MFSIVYKVPYDGQLASLRGESGTLDDAIRVCKMHFRILKYEIGANEVTYYIYQHGILMKELTVSSEDLIDNWH